MHRPPDLSALDLRHFGLLFFGLFALAAMPVLTCDTLPLFDYPNHMARMHVLLALPRSEDLRRFYEIDWRPVPNLAMDAIVPALGRVMPLAWAGKAFVLSTLLLLAGGAAALNRVMFGGWSAWPCLAFLLLYSRILLWGFLNYLFGLGLGLVAFALWIALARRPPALRLAAGALFALALFFAHLLAFGLYGILVMSYEAALAWRSGGRARALARVAFAGAAFLPALAILALAGPGTLAGNVASGRFVRKLDLLFSVFDNYNRLFDIVCFALVVLGLLIAYWRRWMQLAPVMAVPLAALGVAYLAMPSQLATASGADHRIPLLLALVLIGGSAWASPRRGLEALFLGAALVLFLVRLAVVAASWQASDRVYAGLLPALDGLPHGSRLAVAFPPEALNSAATPLAHFPALAVLRRDAFVPTLFAFPTQQPLALRPPYREIADRLPPERLWAALVAGKTPLDASERDILSRYDDLVFVASQPFAVPAAPMLAPIFTAPRFALFKIMPGKARLDGADPPR
jgi:hypothetical protein